eukprot:scaffold6021_cov379-Prasinococcus_capsulatus_cf.AAC.1
MTAPSRSSSSGLRPAARDMHAQTAARSWWLWPQCRCTAYPRRPPPSRQPHPRCRGVAWGGRGSQRCKGCLSAGSCRAGPRACSPRTGRAAHTRTACATHNRKLQEVA